MRRMLGATALFVSLAAPVAAHAALSQLTDLFVFGDSLSDGGNSGLASQQYTNDPSVVFPPPPYFNGQYSNGPVAVEYLWQSFNPGNSSFKPSLAGGTNYAIGGATTGLESFNQVNSSVPDGLKPAYQQKANAWQLTAFATQAPMFNPATSLFVVWLFPNDLFYADTTGTLPGVVPGSSGGANVVANGIANILTTVQTLALAGATNFLVPNMPDLGAAPEFLGTAQAPALTFLTEVFNTNLDQGLTLLESAIPGIDIIKFDTAGLFKKVAANPGDYGFDNATEACIDNLLNQKCDPSKWVFWDGVHPTTSAHRLLAEQFRAAVVPEPATYALFALGLMAVGLASRRRSGLNKA